QGRAASKCRNRGRSRADHREVWRVGATGRTTLGTTAGQPHTQPRRGMSIRCRPALVAALVLGASTLVASGTSPAIAAAVRFNRPIVAVNANQSNNWSGYNQGALEQGGKLFSGITGDWTVPTATQHTAGEDEFSSSWIGIGGGCVDAGCTVTDNTLIQ